jgi:hypothetical protein
MGFFWATTAKEKYRTHIKKRTATFIYQVFKGVA